MYCGYWLLLLTGSLLIGLTPELMPAKKGENTELEFLKKRFTVLWLQGSQNIEYQKANSHNP